MEHLSFIAQERPIGSSANNQIVKYLQQQMSRLGYEVSSIPISCKTWKKEESFLVINGKKIEIFPDTFSGNFHGNAKIILVSTYDELLKADISGKFIILHGPIASDPFMPKDFPFYYPDEHKAIIDAFESGKPAAIIAVTGQHPMCGLKPFPLFEDGNFAIPTAHLSDENLSEFLNSEGIIELHLNSVVTDADTTQLVATKNGKGEGIVLIFAHMDTKYGTPGALDNATGIATLLTIMEKFRNFEIDFTLRIIPFNGEEYYGVAGQLAFLDKYADEMENILLAINIDGMGHKHGKPALSVYNLTPGLQDQINQKLQIHTGIETGPEWYAGDHSMFAFRGIPCIAITSSNLFGEVLQLTHTPDDTLENVDVNQIEATAEFLADFLNNLKIN